MEDGASDHKVKWQEVKVSLVCTSAVLWIASHSS